MNENVHFMWLAGGAKPDHNTIADFRSKRLKDHLKKIFNQVVVLLAEEGAISLREVVLDGTKIEANANRYTFVWGKAIKVSRERIEQQPNEPDFKAVDPEAVSRPPSQSKKRMF